MGLEQFIPGFDCFLNTIFGVILIVAGVAFYMFSTDKRRLGFMRRFSKDRTLKYSSLGLILFGSIVLFDALFA